MKILITGSNGFVGKNLISSLENQDISYTTFSEKREVWNENSFDQYMDQGITHVVHLIAKCYVPESWNNPEGYINVNLNSTISALEFCRKSKAELIFPSSYMYGNPVELPVNEMHPISVLNPYAFSKFLSEETIRFYAEKFGVSATILRVFNIYGPGQNKNFLIPHIIDQALNFDTIRVKDLNPYRDFVFIDDLIDAIISLFEKPKGFQLFNVGYGKSYSVAELIDMVQEILKQNKAIESEFDIRPNEINNVLADITKIKNSIGWLPKTSIREGLKKCISSELIQE